MALAMPARWSFAALAGWSPEAPEQHTVTRLDAMYEVMAIMMKRRLNT
jgi:hypothetical protein